MPPPSRRGHREQQVTSVADRERLHVVGTEHHDHDLRVVPPQLGLEGHRPVVVVDPRASPCPRDPFGRRVPPGPGEKTSPRPKPRSSPTESPIESRVIGRDGVGETSGGGPAAPPAGAVGGCNGPRARDAAQHRGRDNPTACGRARPRDDGGQRTSCRTQAPRRCRISPRPSRRRSQVRRYLDRAGERGDRAEEGHRHSSADPDLAGLGRVVQLVRVEEEPDPKADETYRDYAARRRPSSLVSRRALTMCTQPPSRVRGAGGLRGDTEPGRAGPRRCARPSRRDRYGPGLTCRASPGAAGLFGSARGRPIRVCFASSSTSSCHLRQDHPSLKSGSR